MSLSFLTAANLQPLFNEPIGSTPVMRWNNNSCAIDAVLWLAKSAKVWQSELDRTGTPGDGIEKKASDMLKRKWSLQSRETLEAWRDELSRMWRKDSRANLSGFQGALSIWDAIVEHAASTRVITMHRRNCGCNTPGRMISQPHQPCLFLAGGGLDGRLDSIAPGTTFKTASIQQLLQARFSAFHRDTECVECRQLVSTEWFAESELPRLLSVYGFKNHAITTEEIISFRYYVATPVVQRREAMYVIRAVIFGKDKHVVTVWRDWENARPVGGWQYDNYYESEEDHLRKLSAAEVRHQLRTRGDPELVLLEKLQKVEE